ncbi:unnamed protein product [Brachionus calyciflorus]|uniref:Uncharacterized protein n=1 Tax=Brachionus calyciflorus TaxID=104777 RepID=A0A814IA17_9BILA|nr:unnamed protein product [Brachionus calyciflorus]
MFSKKKKKILRRRTTIRKQLRKRRVNNLDKKENNFDESPNIIEPLYDTRYPRNATDINQPPKLFSKIEKKSLSIDNISLEVANEANIKNFNQKNFGKKNKSKRQCCTIL